MAAKVKITSLESLNFNAAEVPPQSRPDPVPTDWYPTVITEGELEPAKTGATTNRRLTLYFKNLHEGEYKDRLCVDGLNLIHESAQAQEIAQRQFSAICHSVGVLNPKDVSELCNIPFLMRWVYEEPRTDPKTKKTYDARNTFGGAKHLDGTQPGSEGPANAAQAQVPATSGALKPPAWATKKPTPPTETTPPTAPATKGPSFAPKAPVAPPAQKYWAATPTAGVITVDDKPVEFTKEEIEIYIKAGEFPSDAQYSPTDKEDWKVYSETFPAKVEAKAPETPTAKVPPWKRPKA